MKKKKAKPTEQARDEGVPADFSDWWYPSGTDPISGASVGGHPDASRVWSRKDPGKFTHRHYGTTAQVAWLAQRYRDEYQDWVDSGKPKRAKEFVSEAVPLPRLKEFWHGVRALLTQIGKPMPKTKPQDVNAEARRMGLPTKTIEPLDEKDNDTIEF